MAWIPYCGSFRWLCPQAAHPLRPCRNGDITTSLSPLDPNRPAKQSRALPCNSIHRANAPQVHGPRHHIFLSCPHTSYQRAPVACPLQRERVRVPPRAPRARSFDAAQEKGEVVKSRQQDRARHGVPNGNAIATTSRPNAIKLLVADPIFVDELAPWHAPALLPWTAIGDSLLQKRNDLRRTSSRSVTFFLFLLVGRIGPEGIVNCGLAAVPALIARRRSAANAPEYRRTAEPAIASPSSPRWASARRDFNVSALRQTAPTWAHRSVRASSPLPLLHMPAC